MASDPILGSCTSVNTVCSDSDRPVSLSSSASSASLQDGSSAFGSSVALGGCPTGPYSQQNGSDISLDLTPVALLDRLADTPGDGQQCCGWAPGPGRAKERRIKLSHLDRVVLEIVETEQAYVRDLRSIVEVGWGRGEDRGRDFVAHKGALEHTSMHLLTATLESSRILSGIGCNASVPGN